MRWRTKPSQFCHVQDTGVGGVISHTTSMNHHLLCLALLCFTGCSTPGSQYAKAHPELPPAHRQILATGEIPGGIAVEGMTKAQIRLAKGNPNRSEMLNGQDVWAYIHNRFTDILPADDSGPKFGSGSSNQKNFTETANSGVRPTINEVTSIFFNGDRATHAQISQERP